MRKDRPVAMRCSNEKSIYILMPPIPDRGLWGSH
jgi:hypothetical protein